MKNLKNVLCALAIGFTAAFAILQNLMIQKYERENVRLSAEIKYVSARLDACTTESLAARQTILRQNEEIRLQAERVDSARFRAEKELEALKGRYRALAQEAARPAPATCEDQMALIRRAQELFYANASPPR